MFRVRYSEKLNLNCTQPLIMLEWISGAGWFLELRNQYTARGRKIDNE
jgi:hypothetical protein